MMEEQVERIYPKPVFDPTPEDQVRIVVLGGPMAGIYRQAS